MAFTNKDDEIAYKHAWYQENKEQIKLCHQSVKGKEIKRKADKKYRQTEKGKLSHKKACAKYLKTINGKKFNSKHCAKRNRNLGFNILFDNPFAESEQIEWHHIDDINVVALPKYLHYLYRDKYHRENTMEIVKQIYGDD